MFNPMSIRGSLAFLSVLSLSQALCQAQTASTLKEVGAVHRKAQPANDQGLADPGQTFDYVTILLSRTPDQQAALETLVSNQHDPQSPLFRQWLTPEQFGARFGASDDQLSQVSGWLKSMGLTIVSTARGRDWVVVSGTVAQFQTAFHTSIHRYLADGRMHLANATPLEIPAEMSGSIQLVRGLNDFYPEPLDRPTKPSADYTNPSSGAHYLSPDDWATIYDVTPLYAAGYNGSGQRLVIVGDSNILASDIATFRSNFNLPVSPIEMHLVGADPGLTTGQSEANLDLEWSGAIARGATIVFDFSKNVDDALQDAIDNALAPVMSESFGSCERNDTGSSYYSSAYALKANSEGMTWMASAGDAGPANCDNHDLPVAVNGLSATFPAAIPQVTGVGGTQFNEGSGTYWAATNNANGASALGYIPELPWNNNNLPGDAGLSAGGGGPSALFSKPAWQKGPGVPNDGARDTPDVALSAALHDGYRIISNGLAVDDSGTSASSPSFAGLIAILNQYLVAQKVQAAPGLGNINPTLYGLWNSVPSAFHDVTSGNNVVACLIGTLDCPTGTFGFYAGPGYDLATGMGSVDANVLVTNWKAVATPATASNVVVTITPNPVPQTTPTSTGANYRVAILLKETGGGATTLTGYTVNGNNNASEIVSLFGSASISPYGSIGAVIDFKIASPPATNQYTFTGMDPSGKTWSQSVAVKFLAPSTASNVALSINPNPVYQTAPDANGNQWKFTVALAESAGVATTLTGLSINGVSYNSQLASIFPGTSLAANGKLTGTIAMNNGSAPTTEVVTVTGTDSSGLIWTQTVPVQLLGQQPANLPVIAGVANGASFQTTFAPGMEMSIFGTQLAASTAAASTLPLPSTLGGATVTINGANAPLYFASPGQLNVQIPYATAVGAAVVTVNVNGQNAAFTFSVQASAPGIYVGAHSTLVPAATAAHGSAVSLYLTGTGAQNPAIATGAAPPPTTPLNQLPAPTASYAVTVGGIPATVQFFGIPPYLVGVTQVNFTVPAGVAVGNQPVVVTVGGVASMSASLTITQ